ncbi:DUF397 domain-containing protein [Streptomyces gobiensis]|uniref:DUF397 domain-containing protein n=1 Tax=Streptomyces gobiensis TaxID=2875706 RepID=UPI002410DCC9|nr:DUF397 domain-containing protein [Streptomyces gobiensis]UGY91152.1 DUF397 domain-containing protein [Streptomyces gobiensis]
MNLVSIDPIWQKSSYSSTGAECIEVASAPSGIAVRESDDPAAMLTADRVHVETLINAIKWGTFEHLVG